MAGINKVILIGNLGRDPELKFTHGGTAVCNLNLATTRSYFNKSTNEKVEETEWHRVVVWGKDGENANKYLTKGRQVYIEGRLQTRKYEDKDGVTRYSTDIVAETVQYLGGQGGRDTGEHDQRSGGENMDQRQWAEPARGKRPTGANGSSKARVEPQQHDYDNYVPNPAEDDIPF
jgi:single-strand DNA-binding protein